VKRIWTLALLGILSASSVAGVVYWSQIQQSSTNQMLGGVLINFMMPSNIPGSETVIFTYIPLEYEAYNEVIPLGHLDPPDHTFPTDHIYFFLVSQSNSYDVVAPAGGNISMVMYSPYNYTENGENTTYDDYAVYIRHNETFDSYFGHLSELADWIQNQVGELPEGDWVDVNIPVKAGQILGKAKQRPGQYCLDWGAVNWEITLNFIHPKTYPLQTAHAVCPLDYLTDSLKEIAYQKVYRTAEPRGGKIDFDLPGKLSGNWFLEGGEPNVWNWSRHLAFVYDVYDPTQMVVAVGGDALSPLPVSVFNAVGPDPKNVSSENGKITYNLTDQYTYENYTLLVEFVGDEKIKVEAFEGHLYNPDFVNPKYYTRTGPYNWEDC